MQLRETRERIIRRFCAQTKVEPRIVRLLVRLSKLAEQAQRPADKYADQWDAIQTAKSLDFHQAVRTLSERLQHFEDINRYARWEERAPKFVELVFNPGMVPVFYCLVLKNKHIYSTFTFLSTHFSKEEECFDVLNVLKEMGCVDPTILRTFQHFRKYINL